MEEQEGQKIRGKDSRGILLEGQICEMECTPMDEREKVVPDRDDEVE